MRRPFKRTRSFLLRVGACAMVIWLFLLFIVHRKLHTLETNLEIIACDVYHPDPVSVYKTQLRSNNSVTVWPKRGVTADRIMPQLRLQNMAATAKVILAEDFNVVEGREQFVKDECHIKCCTILRKITNRSMADVIIFKGMGRNIVPTHDQVLVWFELESPRNSMAPSLHINWTATYRLDSTLTTPYERFVPFRDDHGQLPPPSRNFAYGKSKFAAWFVSHCNTNNGRMNYVNELQKYITVDIYGRCGPLRCRRGKDDCNRLLSKEYKFYLAFENSNCVDYITEKFYWNGLFNDVLPVVLGARPEDYSKVAPPMSYIHVDDFGSPRDLADYLKTLDKNDTLYNEFFRWKGTGTFINTKFWCRLCAMAHEADLSKTRMFYKNTAKWWEGDGVCRSPMNASLWATWRDVEQKYDHMDKDTFTYN